MYATVVIDIPDTKHRGFTYQIPDTLLDTTTVGCRVLVPVGKRLVQGFIIEIIDTTYLKDVKSIEENLDLIPSLTQELIDLGLWISSYYSNNLFRTLQMLIPAALKTKTEDYIYLGEVESVQTLYGEEASIVEWVASREPVKLQDLTNDFPEATKLIQKMTKEGYLSLKKTFKDKSTTKKVSVVKLKIQSDQLLLEIAALHKSAGKQKQLLEYFFTNETDEEDVSVLLQRGGFSRSTISTLVKKGIIEIIDREINRDPYLNQTFSDKKVILNQEQQAVLKKIIDSYGVVRSKPFLLHGITGSGKTEIYLHTIEYVIEKGRDSIVLVPEIALTPQMVDRFKGRFGEKVAVLHSRLSQGEKLDEWRRIQRGEAKIVIGARSAIFAPFVNLGLIIIDEEHESSYKQEEHPKYHVREIALWRMEHNRAILILGSATPSLESYYSATNNTYELLEMPNRVQGSTLPATHVVDMREELRNGNRTMFSRALQEKIEDRLNKKEQIVLFLNRRGYSTFVMCRTCGYVIKCPHCEISLTYHHTKRSLRCHYCGYVEQEPKVCPECGSKHIRYFGTGTQKVEEELAHRFPGVRVIRMDVDTTSKKGSHQKLLEAFRKEEGDILLGTQMIAKGLDFPKVTLVGVIAADTMLKLPDFRAAERTFQLLTQVSGRAGRHQLPGDVIIQTYSPEHYSVQNASHHDYLSFFGQELEHRRMLDYPPIKRLILIQLSHPELTNVMKATEKLARILKQELPNTTDILGPTPAPISRIKDRYRFQCLIKYSNEQIVITKVQQTIGYLIESFKDKQLLISIDLDPYVLM